MSNSKYLTKLAAAALVGLSLAAAPMSTSAAQELDEIQAFLDLMQRYFRVINDVHEISASGEKSAIFQMQKLQEIHEERGEDAKVADEIRKVLAATENPAVRNAAYMILADVLKSTGRADEALSAMRDALAENLKRLR